MLDGGGATMVDEFNGEGCVLEFNSLFVFLCLEGEKKYTMVTNKVTIRFLSLKSLTHHMSCHCKTCVTSSLNRII
jgi:hypothetical protein